MKRKLIFLMFFMALGLCSSATDLYKPSLTEAWRLTGFNMPEWFGVAGQDSIFKNGTRGITAYGGKLYVVTNNVNSVAAPYYTIVRILDGKTGDSLGVLNVDQSIIAANGGHFKFILNDIESTEDGKLLATNLAVAPSLSNFNIYKWDNSSSTPIKFLTYTIPAKIKLSSTDSILNARLGDKFTVSGSFETGKKAYIIAANYTQPARHIFIWSLSGGVFDSLNPKIIRIKGLSVQKGAFGQVDKNGNYSEELTLAKMATGSANDAARYINDEFGPQGKVSFLKNGSGFVLTGGQTYQVKCDLDGNVLNQTPLENMGWCLPRMISNISFTEKGRDFNVALHQDPWALNGTTTGAKIFVQDATAGLTSKFYCWSNYVAHATNANQTGDVCTDTIGGERYIYILASNNGIVSTKLTLTAVAKPNFAISCDSVPEMKITWDNFTKFNTAIDASASVSSYELVSGTGDTDNSKFKVFDSSNAGGLGLYVFADHKGWAKLLYPNTYSCRVKLTDSYGQTIEKALSIRAIKNEPKSIGIDSDTIKLVSDTGFVAYLSTSDVTWRFVKYSFAKTATADTSYFLIKNNRYSELNIDANKDGEVNFSDDAISALYVKDTTKLKASGKASFTLKLVATTDRGTSVEGSVVLKRYGVTGIFSNKQDLVKISIAPNPASIELTVKSTKEISKIEIFTTSGIKLKEVLNSSNINIAFLNSGIYLAKVTFADGTYGIQKVFKK